MLNIHLIGWRLLISQATCYFPYGRLGVTFVIFPSIISDLETIPAIRPKGLQLSYESHTNGIFGQKMTSAESPASRNSGLSTSAFPVDLPIFHLISFNWHGAFAVLTWIVGVNPPTHSSPSLWDGLSSPG